MSEMIYQKEWLLETLRDAQAELEQTIDKIALCHSDDEIESVLLSDVVNTYAKLNFAINSAALGEDVHAELTEEEMVGYPEYLPFTVSVVHDDDTDTPTTTTRQ